LVSALEDLSSLARRQVGIVMLEPLSAGSDLSPAPGACMGEMAADGDASPAPRRIGLDRRRRDTLRRLLALTQVDQLVQVVDDPLIGPFDLVAEVDLVRVLARPRRGEVLRSVEAVECVA
jgi:hypothetical protein